MAATAVFNIHMGGRVCSKVAREFSLRDMERPLPAVGLAADNFVMYDLLKQPGASTSPSIPTEYMVENAM